VLTISEEQISDGIQINSMDSCKDVEIAIG
jgi:hypothetical protein